MHILEPIVHETLWGGERLSKYCNSRSKSIGHLYSLIVEDDMSSKIMNGKYRDCLFKDYFRENKSKFNLEGYADFPFVIALVDAKDDLSIQVHPDDIAAKEMEGREKGKNESLYFIEKPTAGYIYNGCTCLEKNKVREKVKAGETMDIVGKLPVEKEDYVFIEGGTLHALTAGSLFFEIEENCNITYRFYDFDRSDSSGKKRPLEIEKALHALVPEKQSKTRKYNNMPIAERFYTTRLYSGNTYKNKSNTLECLTLLDGGTSFVENIKIGPGTTVVLEPDEHIELAQSLFIVSRPKLFKGGAMSIELSASMMCANFASLQDEVTKLDAAGIDIYHIDIMDGDFVDNFGMGYQDMNFIRRATKRKIEAHLMVKNPRSHLGLLYDMGIDIIYIHPESDAGTCATLEKIKHKGLSAGIAVNPDTAIDSLVEILHIADRVLVLGVNPGHCGRKYLPFVDTKIKTLLKLREDKEYAIDTFDIYLDGAVTSERISEWAPKGVKGFVLGTSCLFKAPYNYGETIRNIREKLK